MHVSEHLLVPSKDCIQTAGGSLEPGLFRNCLCSRAHCNSHWISSNILAWLAHSHHSNCIGSSGRITLLGAINPCLTQRLAHWPSRGHWLCARFMLYCRYVSPKRPGSLKLHMHTCPGQRFYFFRLKQVLWPLTSQMSWGDAFLKYNGITTAIVASCLMICSAHNSIAKSILLHACETQSPTQVAKLRLMKLALSSKGRIKSGAGASLKIACANKESWYLKIISGRRSHWGRVVIPWLPSHVGPASERPFADCMEARWYQYLETGDYMHFMVSV